MAMIYCFNNGGPRDFLQAVAIAEDGHVLAEHCCSNEFYMKHDLGITSNWKHEHYDKYYGAGNWQLEWVPDPDNHAGIQEAFRLNSELPEEESEQ